MLTVLSNRWKNFATQHIVCNTSKTVILKTVIHAIESHQKNPNTMQIKPAPASAIRTSTLMSYFIPELITTGILYIGLEIINFSFIACTNVALCNATLFISGSLFHLIIKIAEGFSTGLVIMCGQYNGAEEHKKAGQVLTDAFWTTSLIGAAIAVGIYCGAHAIYAFHDVPPEIIELGVPYLQIRALGVFFTFTYLAIVGFLRGIKNPKMPMMFFILGAVTYLFFDYALIFGAWGFPEMGLNGSAVASVIQYGVMLIAALVYIIWDKELLKYGINLFSGNPFSWARITHIRNLVHLSWPVMIDKASLAIVPIWLNKMIGCTAILATNKTIVYDSLTVLKTMERIGILPALAFAQVITYLVSNDYKTLHFRTIKRNIKKVLLYACITTMLFTLTFYLQPHFFLWILNKPDVYNDLIAYTLPIIALLILFDVLQLVLAGALRGAADVKIVMGTRLIVTGLFIPLSYGITLLPITNLILKFVLLYGSVHISLALMGLMYIIRFKSGNWKKQSIEE